MGSGGLIVMDEDSCMVDVARFFLEFVQEESCGKCVPCRVGTKRMLEILNRICEGRGEEADVERLIDLGEMIKDTSLCGLGQTAPNPVLSTIRHFGHEYVEHIRDKHCRAGVCPSLVYAPCESACPADVDIPGFVSLVAEKRYAEALRLHRDRNPFAAICSRVCFHTCEDKCRRSSLDAPVSIRGIKRFMADQEVTIQLPEVRENEQNARRKIAIVGAGPAGLVCAYFLARLGYRPTVFEGEPRPGGMLVQAIPAYRLPREIVAREVRMIERMGVEIFTNMILGEDFTLKSLRAEGYDAVFLGIGRSGRRCAGHSRRGRRGDHRRPGIPADLQPPRLGAGGQERRGHRRRQLGHRRRPDRRSPGRRKRHGRLPPQPRGHARLRRRNRRGRARRDPTAAVDRAGGSASSRASGWWASGACRCGWASSIAPAAAGPRKGATPSSSPPTRSSWPSASRWTSTRSATRCRWTRETGGSSRPTRSPARPRREWIFAGGDAVSGPSSVVEAVAAGERAAVGIDKYLTGKDPRLLARDEGGRYVLRSRRRSDRHASRAAESDSRRTPLLQLRRGRAAVARVGGRCVRPSAACAATTANAATATRPSPREHRE